MGSRETVNRQARRVTAQRQQQQRRVSRGAQRRQRRYEDQPEQQAAHRVSVLRPQQQQRNGPAIRQPTFTRATASRERLVTAGSQEGITTQSATTEMGHPKTAAQAWLDVVVRQGGIRKIRQRFVNDIVTYKKPNGTTKAFDDPRNEQFNRYMDIPLLDETRVRLRNSDIETDFIHASHVSGLPYKMICAQGPVEEAVDRFWMMIAQEGVGVIVQLCQNQEEGREKCADYVPTQPTTYGNVTVCVEERQKMVAAVPAIKKTTLRVTGGGNQSLEVVHLLYDAWPDRDVPLNNVHFRHFRAVARKLTLARHCTMVVHCSAGIGRTGSFAAIELAHHLLLDKNKDLNLQVLARSLRDQRALAIQTDLQYVFIHRALIDAAIEADKITPEGKRMAADFFKEYDTLVQRKRAERKELLSKKQGKSRK